jgi:hypothetical protein
MSAPQTFQTMNPEEFRRVREIFERALDQPPVERRAFVQAACNGNAELQGEVERMLAAESDEHALLDRNQERAASSGSPTAVRRCAACEAALDGVDRFCRTCGTPARLGEPEDEGRFRAGALFANRFRIVAALGRGGMGWPSSRSSARYTSPMPPRPRSATMRKRPANTAPVLNLPSS